MNVIGIGSELVECLRVARMIERHGELFINRVYTAAEIKFCNSRKHATQHFAGRWAAKEAVMRALGVRSRKGFDWRDVEIRRDKSGRLTAAFRGAARDLIEQWNVGDIHLTIAHCRAVATATALVLARPVKRDEGE
ncbi:MAG: holo-ACP synthase [Pirellulales bacterium]